MDLCDGAAAGGGVMERLTYRDKDGFPMMKKRGGFKQGGVERLSAYEDTGLTPEEVLPKDKADEIALKLMRLADLESLCSYTRLRELAEADKEGRLFLLPLEPGRSMLCQEHFERPWVMKNVVPCVQYQSSVGIVFYMGYDVFRGLVEHGKITPLSPEGEKALEAKLDD